ncbi:30S ribosomal protein S18 [Mycoplasma suis KI3806]|uniref:Small ribosomal subunit protein bS18 n=1 Tax=Mycoplasma suis (strain KI_3806) TaxID=708248 RepID=F0V2P2_MYCS3|nr:30S ribosomal protein S18 [Mycoplasma suis]CBZ40114.1 30S ribosomal protein S18 [Mycoplasma suis KI3806]
MSNVQENKENLVQNTTTQSVEENNSSTSQQQGESFSFPSEGRTRVGDSGQRTRKNKKFKKVCWLCRRGVLTIDYKDTEFLKNYLKRYNKVLIHKISGNCLKHQHQLSQAIKRARYIALLPFVPE